MPSLKKNISDFERSKPSNDDIFDDGDETENDDSDGKSDISDKEQIDYDQEIEQINDDDNDEQPKFKIDGDGEGEEYDETCLYDVKNKINSKILETDVFDENMFGDEKIVQSKCIVKPEDRITKPILFKYERVNLLATRRQQLILGAKPMIKINKLISEKDIASLELKAKTIPLIIIRELPNGNIEQWNISELELIN
jgi:DNA-directed RNA polymerase subunit K/omega